MSTKNLNDTIGNRTRDLPACSAETKPTARHQPSDVDSTPAICFPERLKLTTLKTGGQHVPVKFLFVSTKLEDVSSLEDLTFRVEGQLKCDGTRAENRFRLSGETEESI